MKCRAQAGVEGGMDAERFELACGLAGGAADGGEFDGGLERPLAFGGQAGRSEQFSDTSEGQETHVDEAAPADIAAQVESCIGCWHDDGDGGEGVLGLMITQRRSRRSCACSMCSTYVGDCCMYHVSIAGRRAGGQSAFLQSIRQDEQWPPGTDRGRLWHFPD